MGLPNYVGHLTPEQIRQMKRGTIFCLLDFCMDKMASVDLGFAAASLLRSWRKRGRAVVVIGEDVAALVVYWVRYGGNNPGKYVRCIG